MKVIGSSSYGGVIVEMSHGELGELTGAQVSETGTIYDEYFGWRSVLGVEFKIREGWKRLHALNKNREQLNKAIRQLRACADVLEPLESLVSVPEEAKADEGPAP